MLPDAGYQRATGIRTSNIMDNPRVPSTTNNFSALGQNVVIDRQAISGSIHQRQQLTPTQVKSLRNTNQPQALGERAHINSQVGRVHRHDGFGYDRRLSCRAEGVQLGARPRPHLIAPGNLTHHQGLNQQGDRVQLGRARIR